MLDIQDCKNDVSKLLHASVNHMLREQSYEGGDLLRPERVLKHRKAAAEYATILLGLKSIY